MAAPRHRTALLGVATGLALLATGALAESWRTYVNARFGATIDYPDRFSVRDRPPDNGDGQGFSTIDGRARMSVYGSYNVGEETTRALMDSARQPGVTYTYANAGPDSYVLSGLRGALIVYRRCVRSRSDRTIFNCVSLDYPSAEAGAWDAVVTRISRSLRSGRVT